MTEYLLTITGMIFVASMASYIFRAIAICFWRIVHVLIIAENKYGQIRGKTLRRLFGKLWNGLYEMLLVLSTQALSLIGIALFHCCWIVRHFIFPNRIQILRQDEFSSATPYVRVIFVHGTHSSGDFFPRWRTLLDAIQSQFHKIEVFTATWSGRNNELVRLREGANLGRICDELFQQDNPLIPIRVIGHSYGWSVGARLVSYLLDRGYDARLVSIATPYVRLDKLNDMRRLTTVILSGAILYILVWAVMAWYIAQLYYVQHISTIIFDFPGPYPLLMPEKTKAWTILFALGCILIAGSVIGKLYIARKLHDKYIFQNVSQDFCGRNHAAAIVVNGDEVELLVRLSFMAEELEYVQIRFSKFWMLLSHINRRRLEQQYGNKWPSPVSVIGAIIIGAGVTLAMATGVHFTDSAITDPRIKICIIASIIAFLLSPATSRHSKLWLADIASVAHILFLPILVSSFVKHVLQARLAGLWPWSLSLFYRVSIQKTLYDTWRPAVPVYISKNDSASLKHCSVLENNKVINQVCTQLLEWVPVLR